MSFYHICWGKKSPCQKDRPWSLEGWKQFPKRSSEVSSRSTAYWVAEHWRTDAFELWCWRRHLRVPWTARRSNQSILKEISPEYSLEGLMTKLKLQYFGHLLWRRLIGKDLDAGKGWRWEKGMTEDEMGGWHHQLDRHGFEWTLGVGNGQGGLECCDSWGWKELNTTERLNWTELND